MFKERENYAVRFNQLKNEKDESAINFENIIRNYKKVILIMVTI